MNISQGNSRERRALGRNVSFHSALLFFLIGVSSIQADSWQQRASVPGGRAAHSAVWTGHELIVWGGGINNQFLNTGARYTPSTDTWRTTSLANAPSPRWFHAAVWTGEEMIIWGGRANFFGRNNFNDGARYNPTTDRWTPLSNVGAPTPRADCSAVWTGEEMIVWGGSTEGDRPLADGAAYNPATDRWRPISASGLRARMEATAVWTGSEMILFGGSDASVPGWVTFGDGARYNPITDSWTPLPSSGAPSSRTGHTAVWTGERMIVWGGRVLPAYVTMNDGAIYSPGTDTWTPIPSSSNAPQARMLHAAAWTGTEMIIWGGQVDAAGTLLNTGARFHPATGGWTPTSLLNAPGKRMFWRPDNGIWTGRGLLVCAGSDYPASLDSTYLYTLADTPCPPVIREQPLSLHLAVGSPATFVVGAEDCAVGARQWTGQQSAGPIPHTFVLETGTRAGELEFEYDFFLVPDSLRVYYQGQRIFDRELSGAGMIRVPFGPGSARNVNIVVNEDGGPENTVWQYAVRVTTQALRYQWRKNGVALAGETNATLHLPSVSLTDAGDYSVVVANSESATVSAVATLTVEPRPTTTNCVAVPSGLVAWWRGEGDATDFTGVHHGTPMFGAGFAEGLAGQAFRFDSGRARVSIPDHANFRLTGSLTIEGWVRPAGTGPSIIFMRGDNRPGLDAYLVGVGPSGYFQFQFNTRDNRDVFVTTRTAPTVGRWTHLAAVLDDATGDITFYVDGVAVARTNTPLRPIQDLDPSSEPAVGLGNHGGTVHNFPFQGLVDEWALYSRVLSTAEIAAVFRAGAAGKCASTNPPQPEVVFDLSKDFSRTSNPAGAWSYGYSATLGGAFNLLTFEKDFASENGVPISAWQVSDSQSPAVARVMGNGIAVSEGGAFTAASGAVYAAPGDIGSPGEFAVVRFTVPAGRSGVYRVESVARSNFSGPMSGDSEFHLLRNGQEVLGRFLPTNSAALLSYEGALAAGDQIDFVVGRGADRSAVHSSLKVQVRIVFVTNAPPETNRVFDVSKDFALSSNPNGPWSYGYLTGSLDGPFDLVNTPRTFGAENGVPIAIWQLNGAKPWVAKVVGTNTAVSLHFNGPPGTVYFGPNPDATPLDYGAIRFTVPAGAGGTYRLVTAVRSLYDSTRSADADFHVVKNGQELFGAVVPPNSGRAYSNVLALVAGDRIDFVAGRGPNGLPDTGLKIQATLTPVALPPSTSLMSADARSMLGNGKFRVTGIGPAGTPCWVERSTDLVHWESVGAAVEVSAGVFEFIDAQPSGGPACFYRMSSPAP